MPSLRWTLRGEESDETDIPTLGELLVREADPLTSSGRVHEGGTSYARKPQEDREVRGSPIPFFRVASDLRHAER